MKKNRNFLDFIPKKNPAIRWEERDSNLVTVLLPHKGLFDRLAQLLFHRPPVSKIDLDIYGSFVWLQIDGQRSVYKIAALLDQQFGSACHPLYARLCTYLRTLRSYHLILY